MTTEHDYIDVRDLFVSINPHGLDQSELARDGASFVEPHTINDYHLFRAGYQAALEAQQGQGEPVGYQIRSKTDRPGSQWKPWRECCDTERALHGHEVGRFNQFGIMREIRPIFASAADPAEVARLELEIEQLRLSLTLNDCASDEDKYVRAENRQLDAEVERLRADLETMRRKNEEYCDELMARTDARVQLAEAHALLARVVNSGALSSEEYEAVEAECCALSASAEPSAPVEIEEPVCKGAWELGTACGKCSRCKARAALERKP